MLLTHTQCFVRVRRRVFGFHNFYCQFRRHFTFIWITCGIPVYSGVNWSRVIHNTSKIDSTTRWYCSVLVSLLLAWLGAILLHQLHRQNVYRHTLLCVWAFLQRRVISRVSIQSEQPAYQQINKQATKWTAKTKHDQQSITMWKKKRFRYIM